MGRLEIRVACKSHDLQLAQSFGEPIADGRPPQIAEFTVADGRPRQNQAEIPAEGRPSGWRPWCFASIWVSSSVRGSVRRVTVIYSLMAGCKLCGIDLFTYLRDILTRISTHPVGRIEELLPRNWRSSGL